jgi:hypothetical protein
MNAQEYNGNLLNLYLISLVPLEVFLQINVYPRTALIHKEEVDALFDLYDFATKDRYVRIEVSYTGEYKEKAVAVRFDNPLKDVYYYDDIFSTVATFSVLFDSKF